MQIFNSWYLNYSVYPLISGIYPTAREIGTLAAIASLLAFSISHYKFKCELNFKYISILASIILCVAFWVIALGVSTADPLLVSLGAAMRGLAYGWILILIGLALCSLNNKLCALAITLGLALGYLLRIATLNLPISFCYLVLAFSTLIICLCSYQTIKHFNFTHTKNSTEVMRITQPNTTISLNHKFFLSIFIFRLAFGFALVFGAYQGRSPHNVLVYIVVLAIMAYFYVSSRFNIDYIYLTSTLFILSGYLFALVFVNYNSSLFGISNSLLFAGSELFDVLIWIALSRAAKQNLSNAIMVIGWGRLCSTLALLIGTSTGQLINYYADLLFATLCITIFIFIFTSFNLITLRNFSFEKTIHGIHEFKEINVKDLVLENFDHKVSLITHHYQLTPRESEIYSLMVKGRNAGYINEELQISINTVKTHVSNIYKKLEVHSQQELIDQFEGSEVSEPTPSTLLLQ